MSNIEDLAKELPRLQELAKELWGEYDREYTKQFDANGMLKVSRYYHKPKYQYHLERMIIAEDPIKYLRENI